MTQSNVYSIAVVVFILDCGRLPLPLCPSWHQMQVMYMFSWLWYRDVFTAELGEAVIGADKEVVAADVMLVIIRWAV